MLRPGGVARPALARAFTTKLSWAGSPPRPTLVMTEWLIVIYHCRTFTGRTDSLMGCEQRTLRLAQRNAEAGFSLRPLRRPLRPPRLIGLTEVWREVAVWLSFSLPEETLTHSRGKSSS